MRIHDTNELRPGYSYFKTDYARPAVTRIHRSRVKLFCLVLCFIAIGSLVNYEWGHRSLATTKPSTPVTDIATINLPLPEIPRAAVEQIPTTQPAESVQKSLPPYHVQPGDSLASIFSSLKLSSRDLHAIVNLSKRTKSLSKIHPGQEIRFQINSQDNSLMKMWFAEDAQTTLLFTRDLGNSGFAVQELTKEYEIATRYAAEVIQDSLYSAGQRAGLNDRLIMELARIFGWDIDFALDIRPGDSFQLIYEENYLHGKKVAQGDIVAATFTSQGKTYSAIRYTDESNRTDYYSLDGRSVRKAFIRTPVNFTRISSKFSLGRKHPVLHRIRAHKGVDYAAATGTPVKATGEGKIKFIGRRGGYGKAIIIQHGQRYSTLYAHLNNYAKKLRIGSSVHQGQIIGFVGSTGLATGPHLHYEFHVYGKHRDPLKVKLPDAKPINRKYLAEFNAYARVVMEQLASHSRARVKVAQTSASQTP